MELKRLFIRAKNLLPKYKYAILVLVIGLFFLMIPSFRSSEDDIKNQEREVITEKISDEERLKEILQQIKGAGNVSVLLTYANGEETIYQMNSDNSDNENSNSMHTDTVTITDSSRNEKGLIRQVIPAKYMGAVVVCTGADDSLVKLSIVEAVSKATGLGANQITVLKMK